MKKLFCILIILLFLTACGPKITGELKTREKIVKRPVEKIVAKEVFEEPIINKTVKQMIGRDKVEWGFDEDNNLVYLQKENKIIKFYYKNSLLRKISDDEKSLELEYVDGMLSSALGDTEMPRHYVLKNGLLEEADDYKFTYNEDGLWIYRENVGATLTFYYEDGLLDFIKKGNVVTHFYFNEDEHVKRIEDGSRNFILGYGRGDKLASLSGAFYGTGEMFDYGKGRISVISNEDSSIFYGEDELAEKAFNLYVSCTKLRTGYMVFEPLAYVAISSYFDTNVYDYMLENFYCEWIR